MNKIGVVDFESEKFDNSKYEESPGQTPKMIVETRIQVENFSENWGTQPEI